MATWSTGNTSLIQVLRTAKPPSPRFLAIGAIALAISAAIVAGLRDSAPGSGLWADIGKWQLANFSAVVATVAIATVGRVLVPTRLYSEPSRALALSYGIYMLAGVVGGLARVGPIHLLDLNGGRSGILLDAANVGAILGGALFVGFVANQYQGLVERIRTQQQMLHDRIDELANENMERKRVERALRESEERSRQNAETLKAIQSSMTEGIVVFDSTGHVLQINNAAQAIMGVAEDEARGMAARDFIHAAKGTFDPPDAAESMLLSLERPAPAAPRTHKLTLNGDQAKELDLTVFPIALESASSMAGVLIRDVTTEREVERRRNTFVSVASHELRNPLAAMMGYSEMLVRRDPPERRKRRWLQHIYQGTRRFATIVDDLLNVSRIQSGNLAIRQQRLSLQDVLEEVLGDVDKDSGKHFISSNVAHDIPDLTLDREKLIQVFTNLLDNAIKYSPDGGSISVTAKYDTSRERVTIAVADSGIGISSEHLEEIFTPFHRIRQPATEGIRGTGLGLYVVKELVELMGGAVLVESGLGRGSTFSIVLPVGPVRVDNVPAPITFN